MASRWTYKARRDESRRDGACRERLDRHGDKTRERDTHAETRHEKKTQVPRRPAHDLRRADRTHSIFHRSIVRLDY